MKDQVVAAVIATTMSVTYDDDTKGEVVVKDHHWIYGSDVHETLPKIAHLFDKNDKYDILEFLRVLANNQDLVPSYGADMISAVSILPAYDDDVCRGLSEKYGKALSMESLGGFAMKTRHIDISLSDLLSRIEGVCSADLRSILEDTAEDHRAKVMKSILTTRAEYDAKK